jgi:DNA-binding MarR family transcriptional regulator
MSPNGPDDRHLTNIVGAFALALADGVRGATEATAGHTAAGPAALVGLSEFLGHGSMDQLRRAVGLSPSGAVRLVDRLAEDGYVQRGPGSDARSVALSLTAAGRAAARRVRSARAAAIDQALADLSDDERRSLTGITEKMLATITRQRLADRERGEPPSGGWLCRLCDFDACGRREGSCPSAATANAHNL